MLYRQLLQSTLWIVLCFTPTSLWGITGGALTTRFTYCNRDYLVHISEEKTAYELKEKIGNLVSQQIAQGGNTKSNKIKVCLITQKGSKNKTLRSIILASHPKLALRLKEDQETTFLPLTLHIAQKEREKTSKKKSVPTNSNMILSSKINILPKEEKNSFVINGVEISDGDEALVKKLFLEKSLDNMRIDQYKKRLIQEFRQYKEEIKTYFFQLIIIPTLHKEIYTTITLYYYMFFAGYKFNPSNKYKEECLMSLEKYTMKQLTMLATCHSRESADALIPSIINQIVVGYLYPFVVLKLTTHHAILEKPKDLNRFLESYNNRVVEFSMEKARTCPAVEEPALINAPGSIPRCSELLTSSDFI